MNPRARRIDMRGAEGGDLRNFCMVYRADRDARVIAFTAAQIPGIDAGCPGSVSDFAVAVVGAVGSQSG